MIITYSRYAFLVTMSHQYNTIIAHEYAWNICRRTSSNQQPIIY